MQAVAELGAERIVDQAVPGDAGEGLEAGRDGKHVVVRLAAGLGAGMAGVPGTVIHDLNLCGREDSLQGLPDAFGTACAGCHDGNA